MITVFDMETGERLVGYELAAPAPTRVAQPSVEGRCLEPRLQEVAWEAPARPTMPVDLVRRDLTALLVRLA